MANKNDSTHLTMEERLVIQTGISNGSSKKSIAETIGKDATTVAKEIRKHREKRARNSFSYATDCANIKKCGKKCVSKCEQYTPFTCKRRDRTPGACNGCEILAQKKCHWDKYVYDAKRAQSEYEEELRETRDNEDELDMLSIHSHYPEDYGHVDQKGREDFFSSIHDNINTDLPKLRHLFAIKQKQGVDNSTNRQKDIVEFLEKSKYAHKILKNNSEIGFYARRGDLVKLISGERIDIIDWLLREGFEALECVLYYTVSYTQKESQYPEKFSFFEIQLNI
ncbi:MAG: helix-turn-helix domain-containing protein [Candidatus Moranbacteria bacterium]|nr:helix-turn-helix domain-containing protein [Candidatus Moranbacteria bacterium]